MRTVLPAAITMMAYALAVLSVGMLTWMVAPPGASAVTALVISIVAALAMTICAVMLLRVGASRGLALAGLYLGIAIPLLVAGGAGWRLRASLDKANEFNQAVRSRPVVVVPRTAENAAEPQPVAYQTVGIGAMVALSGFAFVALLATARRIPPHAEPQPDVTVSAAPARHEPLRPMPSAPSDPEPELPPIPQ